MERLKHIEYHSGIADGKLYQNWFVELHAGDASFLDWNGETSGTISLFGEMARMNPVEFDYWRQAFNETIQAEGDMPTVPAYRVPEYQEGF